LLMAAWSLSRKSVLICFSKLSSLADTNDQLLVVGSLRREAEITLGQDPLLSMEAGVGGGCVRSVSELGDLRPKVAHR
jgi:hypothetical protein